MRQAFAIVLVALSVATAALSKEAVPDQNGAPDTSARQPHAVGKPVTTTIIKRCPEGYDLVIRVDGRRGCAKDIVPVNE
jgi:hypothetical protein